LFVMGILLWPAIAIKEDVVLIFHQLGILLEISQNMLNTGMGKPVKVSLQERVSS